MKLLRNPTAQEKSDVYEALVHDGYRAYPGVQGPGIQTPQPESVNKADELSGDGRRWSGWTIRGPDQSGDFWVPASLEERFSVPEWVQSFRDAHQEDPGIVGRTIAALKRAEHQPVAAAVLPMLEERV